MIYLSTGGFSNNTFKDTSCLFDNKIVKAFELSAGKYTPSLLNDLTYVSENFEVALHNYFPVPKEPFVFNLASFNLEILKQSKEHAMRAIELSSLYGSKFYSFHAGYLLDPQPSELGHKIKSKKLNSREDSIEHFILNVKELATFAEKHNVTLLIENNVISKANLDSFNCNPLLMSEPVETQYIFSKLPRNVKLLIDVAHLKVSAKTLNFDPVKYLKDFSDITLAYHISDNNGLEDSNEPFTENSWFVDHIRKDLEYYSLEIYVSDIEVLEEQYKLLSEILG